MEQIQKIEMISLSPFVRNKALFFAMGDFFCCPKPSHSIYLFSDAIKSGSLCAVPFRCNAYRDKAGPISGVHAPYIPVYYAVPDASAHATQRHAIVHTKILGLGAAPKM